MQLKKIPKFVTRAVACAALCLHAGLALGQAIPGVSFEVVGFEVQGANPLSAAQSAAVLDAYVGAHDGLERLLEASTKLERAIRDKGHAFHRVVLPPQTLEGGIVRLEVLSFKITEVRVEGNAIFSRENILASLPLLEVGAEPDTKALSRAVRVANRHPAKTLKVGFADSKQGDGIVAKVTVADERPWSLFATLDDTGSEETGELRFALGGQHSNLFGRDHALTVSYTTAPQRPAHVRQRGLNYEVPFYARALSTTFFYADSDVDSGQIAGLEISGAGRFLGARARFELLRGSGYTHAITLGIDDKIFQSSAVPIGGSTSLFPNVRTRPISIEYSREYEPLWGNWGFSVSYARNIPAGASNNVGAYRGNRPGSTVSWDVLRWRSYVDYGFSTGWLFRGALNGQWATELLLSGEQFGIGGARSVRGFGERVVSGDSGVRAGFELWTPPLTSTVNARLLGFAEWGQVVVHQPGAGQKAIESAAGAGVGVRMQGTYWHAQGSLARVMNGALERDPGDVRAHFNVVWRY